MATPMVAISSRVISIHAPREGSDVLRPFNNAYGIVDFNPRSP